MNFYLLYKKRTRFIITLLVVFICILFIILDILLLVYGIRIVVSILLPICGVGVVLACCIWLVFCGPF